MHGSLVHRYDAVRSREQLKHHAGPSEAVQQFRIGKSVNEAYVSAGLFKVGI